MLSESKSTYNRSNAGFWRCHVQKVKHKQNIGELCLTKRKSLPMVQLLKKKKVFFLSFSFVLPSVISASKAQHQSSPLRFDENEDDGKDF